MPRFACPSCGVERGGPEADCPACGWARSPQAGGSACPCCGSGDHSWGRAEARLPADPGQPWLLWFVGDGRSALQELRVRRCNQCGNAQFFVRQE